MDSIFHFSSSWYVLILAFLLSWSILLISRKEYWSRRETKEQLYVASTGLFAMVLMEVFAIHTNLWHYTPENWPIILWPTYFIAILFGYQLVRFIERLFS